MADTFQWQAADGESMHGRVWKTDRKTKGTVCLVHGLGEHIGRYGHVAKTINEAGWDVAGFDHRGHGQSGGRRGVIPSYGSLLDDVRLFMVRQRQGAHQQPVVLYGHSMGGNLVLNYLLQQPQADLPHKAVVTSPALHLPIPNAQQAIMPWAAKLLPHVTIKNGIPASKLSRDPAVVKAYNEDPLVHDRISFLLAHGLVQFGSYAIQRGAQIPVPTLLLHGRDDAVCLISGSEALAASSTNVSLKAFDAGFHELHNDDDKEEVLRTVAQWINT